MGMFLRAVPAPAKYCSADMREFDLRGGSGAEFRAFMACVGIEDLN
jgi:hypothetical protein